MTNSSQAIIERYGAWLFLAAAAVGLAIGILGRDLLELILMAGASSSSSSAVECPSSGASCVFAQIPNILVALMRGFAIASLAGLAMLAIALVLLITAAVTVKRKETAKFTRALWFTGIGSALIVPPLWFIGSIATG